MSLPANATARLLSAAASDNATLIVGVSALVSRVIGYNASSAARWLKLYDKSTAPASTDTPRKSYCLPPGAGFAFDLNDYFAFGLGYRITTGSADNDAGALTAGDILGLNLDYR
jgi:hypothetical protein